MTAPTAPTVRQRFVPALSYADAAEAIEFLCRAFGFEERFRLDMPDGSVGHAELALGDQVVTLAGEWEAGGMASPITLGGVHSQLHCYVDDVDAHYDRALAEGAIIATQPQDQFYGERTYRAMDPEGHRWVFATPLETTNEEHA